MVLSMKNIVVNQIESLSWELMVSDTSQLSTVACRTLPAGHPYLASPSSTALPSWHHCSPHLIPHLVHSPHYRGEKTKVKKSEVTHMWSPEELLSEFGLERQPSPSPSGILSTGPEGHLKFISESPPAISPLESTQIHFPPTIWESQSLQHIVFSAVFVFLQLLLLHYYCCSRDHS